MTASAFLPGPAELAREALIVMGGAIIAAAIIGELPALRAWIKRQWDGTQNPVNPWS